MTPHKYQLKTSIAFTFAVYLLGLAAQAGLLWAEEYDFIVVGAGAAGCLVASRLSENPDWTVLLIEAGGEENFIQDIPLLAPALEFTPADWGYRTQRSNSSCLGMTNGQCHWPRGKVMGGSTVLNYMTFIRGNKLDYDNWASLGNTGWSYDEVLPHFKNLENMTIPEYRDDATYHSTKGELVMSHPPFHTDIATAFVDAGVESGFQKLDYNGEQQIGYSYVQSTMKDGVRHSSNRAFIRPFRDRRNLYVEKASLVTKILIHEDTKTAYGVEYKKWLLPERVHAKKEVIICGGAINSPQLLMLSGIGPADHLKDIGIPVIQDSKVGYNLQDHMTLGNLYYTLNDSSGLQVFNIPKDVLGAIQYFLTHKGILTIPGSTEALGFLDYSDPPDGDPEIELLLASATSAVFFVWLSWGANFDLFLENYSLFEFKNAYMVFPILMHPYSRGRIMLKSKSPYEHPLIDPNYFSDQRDIETIIRGIRSATNLTKLPALQKHGAQLYTKPLSVCKHHQFDSDEYWECCIRHLTFTFFHPSGTCKMGPDSDPDAVVDPTLKVRGIKHLRVADASIIPVIVAAHLQGPTYMIGEKAADMIKREWS